MLPLLVFTGSLICLGNLIGLALFALAYRRQVARQRDVMQQTRQDFQEAINQILDRYQMLKSRLEDEEEDEATEAPTLDAPLAGESGRRFETIASTLQAAPAAPAPGATLPAVGLVGTGMNLAKRTQIVRLHRRGETPARIAAELGVGLAEVELVVKVHAATAS